MLSYNFVDIFFSLHRTLGRCPLLHCQLWVLPSRPRPVQPHHPGAHAIKLFYVRNSHRLGGLDRDIVKNWDLRTHKSCSNFLRYCFSNCQEVFDSRDIVFQMLRFRVMMGTTSRQVETTKLNYSLQCAILCYSGINRLVGSNLSHLTNPKLLFHTYCMFSSFAYKYQSVIGISFSLSQSDPIKRCLLYKHHFCQ